MLGTNGVTLRFGKRTLFEDVNVKFTPGNCYGIIGANGAGKSTFLKILSGEIEPSEGEVYMSENERLGILKQNHYEYDDVKVIDTVIRGNARLYEIMQEKDALYAKPDFNDEDGIKAGELEAEFAELNGWMAETDAAQLLNGLGIDTELHEKFMRELTGPEKVKVLLAQALFGNPDVLLLDEPTNNLDIAAISWLEEFLINFENTVIVVSHDRHFLNKVCTHTLDIDYNKITMYIGNYDFWYESSQLALKQMKESNKKKEEKIKELEDFIRRFSANASKSKQATSRKKTLEKIQLDEIKPSTRRYPYIEFKPENESGKEILEVENICKEVDGEKVLNNVSFKVLKGDKIALVGSNGIAKTTLFKILMGELKADSGKFTFGKTINPSYLPQDNDEYFKSNKSIVEWIADEYHINDETVIRSFLGRMLFSGDEALKKVNVLSGGEKARCMLSRCMLESPNFILLDEPTNHLDLESITALNNGLIRSTAEMIFVSHDHQFIQTIANRIIEITDNGVIDKRMTYDEYLEQNQEKMKSEKSF
ncbi:MAG: ATP-binding cassette domain-containing protein [Clostridia bacterium]|nr:ATP-binding cassette domain-containing protein [Clostridia bacterium]